MNISFDFDGCLTRPDIQIVAKQLMNEGNNVCILTTRTEIITQGFGNHNTLFEVAKDLGITKIIFTNGQRKYKYLKAFDLHYDDNPDEKEIAEANNVKCKIFLV